jgi:hypothetical protein
VGQKLRVNPDFVWDIDFCGTPWFYEIFVVVHVSDYGSIQTRILNYNKNSPYEETHWFAVPDESLISFDVNLPKIKSKNIF